MYFFDNILQHLLLYHFKLYYNLLILCSYFGNVLDLRGIGMTIFIAAGKIKTYRQTDGPSRLSILNCKESRVYQ